MLKKCPTSFFYKNIGLKIFWIFIIVNISNLEDFFDFVFQSFFYKNFFLKGLCIEGLGGRIHSPHFWRACPVSAGPALSLRVFFYKNIIRNNKLWKLTSEDFFKFFFYTLLPLLSQMVPKELFFLPYKILWSSTI